MKNTIKIWPYIDDISQSIIPYQDFKYNINSKVYIDFSLVKNITSSGIAITIIKLLKIINKYDKILWEINEPEDNNLKLFLLKTGALNILNYEIINLNNSKTHNMELFSHEIEIIPSTSFENINQSDTNTTSFPLINLKYKNFNRRIFVEEFVDYLIKILLPYKDKYKMRQNIFIKMLLEIAKNSEDHTTSHAIFGMDIVENENNKKAKLLFSFCDLGNGIHGNIKNFIVNDPNYRNNVTAKMGIVDSYHYAFKPGFTTLNNKYNKGIGMTMILECANILGIKLNIFDARSMGFIPKDNTHTEIRRNFWDTGNPVGFYYYGILTLNN